MADGEAFDINVPPPSGSEVLDTVWREDQVEVKRSVLELYEILASLDLRCLLVVEVETQLSQSSDISA